VKLLFPSDYAKIHRRARAINKTFHARDGVGSYDAALSQAKNEYCRKIDDKQKAYS
jgi:hypothetical protein